MHVKDFLYNMTVYYHTDELKMQVLMFLPYESSIWTES